MTNGRQPGVGRDNIIIETGAFVKGVGNVFPGTRRSL